MADSQVIEVRLPDGVQPTPAELELLRGIFEAVVTLRFTPGAEASAAATQLASDGWTVRTRLGWVAEARKGGEFEEVTGASRNEALDHLQQLVRADRVLSAF